MFQILATGRGWFHTHSVLINDIAVFSDARRIRDQLAAHFYASGFRSVAVSIIIREKIQ